MKEQILIVDDDNDILELLEYSLSSAGFDTLGFLNTKNVRQVLTEEKIDLILMDRNLPEIEGSMYIEMLRNKNIDTPVIFISAKDTQDDIKDGFLKGADDYITKPFDMQELILRVKAVLKRYNNDSKELIDTLKYQDMDLDLNMHRVNIDSVDIDLTKLETNLLQTLIKNKGRVLDRDYLLKNIWKGSNDINQKTVNVAIKRLKEKIDPNKDKDYIKTIRGVGYLLA